MASTEFSNPSKEFGTNGHIESDPGRGDALDKFRSAASIQMSPELFEKLYLSPHTNVKGDLRKTFGNPTPISLVGFIISLTPLSCDLMGWRGAGGSGAASIPVFIFMGGVLTFLGGILEWVLGNSFPSIVFCAYGGFYLAYGCTLIPSFGAFSSYAPPNATSAAEGLTTKGFNATLGFWLLFMGLLSLVFLVCALRTNVVFVIIFLTLTMCFGLLTGAYFVLADDYVGNAALAHRLVVGGGASGFVCSLAGWYIFVAIMFGIIDFPIQIPVGDLSTVIRGKSETSHV